MTNEHRNPTNTNSQAFQRLADATIETELRMDRERITGVSDYFDRGGEAAMTHQDVIDALRLREKT